MKLFVRAAGLTLLVGLAAVVLAILGLMLRSIWQELEARRPQAPVEATATVWSLAGSAVGTAEARDRAEVQATGEAVAAQATQAARYCTDPAKAVLRVSYHTRPNAYAKDVFDYVAQGSVENTCTYPISIRLFFSSKVMPVQSGTEHDGNLFIFDHSLFVFTNPLRAGEIREFNEIVTWSTDPYERLTPYMSILE